MSDKKPQSSEEELSKIDALIAQHSESLEGPQLRYSRAVKYGEDQKKGPSVPHGGYRCHKCGEAGHFIQDCPTDEGKAGKVRQARGIPRTFLESVTEAEAAKSGGAFVSAEGDLVVMKSASKEERLRLVGQSVDVELQRSFGKSWEAVKKAVSCFLCGSVARNPVSTGCCGELFCRDCILSHLDRTVIAIDDDAMECPNCDRKNLSMADLVEDRAVMAVVGQSASMAQPGGGVRAVLPHSKRQRFTKDAVGRTKISVELEGDVGSAPESDTAAGPRITRHANTVLVPGGQKNPFFQIGAPLMSEVEFETWKSDFKSALVRTGQQVPSA